MELKGKVVGILDLQTGEGRNGTWRKQEYVLETLDAKYPKKVCVAVWGDKIDQFGLQVGEEVIASIEIESREFNGRWYTNVQAWRVQREQAQDMGINQEVPMESAPPSFVQDENETDDLPF